MFLLKTKLLSLLVAALVPAVTFAEPELARHGGGGGGGGSGGGNGGGGDSPNFPRPRPPSPPSPSPPSGGGGGGGSGGGGGQVGPLELSAVRSIDGSGEDSRAQAGSLLFRLTVPEYEDGVGDMSLIPNARYISITVADNGSSDEVSPNGATDMLWAWGQFIDHDMDLTTAGTDEPSVSIVYPACAMYEICVIPFTRSVHRHVNGIREQVNQISSFLDGSMIYGSDEVRANALRQFQDGRLRMGPNNLLPFNDNVQLELDNDSLPRNDPSKLFLAGDVRANEQIGLTAMHTLFVREHNRLVRLLKEAFPNSTDENLYQMGRKIVGAEIQRITYNEFLPVLLGPSYAPKLSDYKGYNPNIHPGISNEFSTVAFRVGHTMLSPNFSMGPNAPAMSLIDAFFNPSIISDNPQNVDNILAGFIQQSARQVDTKVIDEVRNVLFGFPISGVGLDLVALNIQRGRDHGIPKYNHLRIGLGLNPVSSFSDITNDETVQLALFEAYNGDIDAIDAWIGGLAEQPPNVEDGGGGGMVGELFATIISDQFHRLMVSDPFFYLNDPDLMMTTTTMTTTSSRNNNNHNINPSILREKVIDLRRVKLSDILAWNTDIPINHDVDVMTSGGGSL